MKHKLSLLAAIAMMATTLQAQNFDFSAIAPSGQTLYYNIVNGSVEVVGMDRFETPSGILEIPSSVTFGGVSYAVTAIGTNAFSYCELLSVTIPSTITTIGQSAFYDSRLESVSLGEGLVTIGSDAFSKTELTSIVIPNAVVTIGEKAFNCRNMTHVIIGESVTSIGIKAFGGGSLEEVVSLAITPPTLGFSAFGAGSHFHASIPVWVPCVSVNDYRSAPGWHDFTNIQCDGTEGIHEVNGSNISIYSHEGSIFINGYANELISVYDIMGRQVASAVTHVIAVPASGVYMVKIGNLPTQKVVVVR